MTRQPSVASSIASVVDEEDGASGAEEFPYRYDPPKEDPPKKINDEVVSVQATATTTATAPKKIRRFFKKQS